MIPNLLEKKIFEKNIPLDIQLELTWRCNQRCPHCYQYAPSDNELSVAEIKDIIVQLAEAGCLYLAFTGGEPLLKRGFWDIAEFAYKKHFALTLQTNGTLIGEKEADKIAGLNLFVAHITIHASNAAMHDKISGLKGSFKRVLEAVELLRSRGIKVILNHTVIKTNYGEYQAIKKLKQDLGDDVELRVSPFLFMKHDGSARQAGLRLDDSQIKEFYLALRNETGWNPLENKALICNFGRCVCTINAEGKVYPCVAVPLAVGDLRKSRFIDIWQNSPELKTIRSVKAEDLKDCKDCKLNNWCFRCSGFSYQETGDLFRGSKEARRFAEIIKEVNEYEETRI